MNNKNIILGQYKIQPKYVKILEVIHRILSNYNREVLLKDKLISNIEELINNKKMSYDNVFILMNFLETSIEASADKHNKIVLAMMDLHNYLSKYFMIARIGLVFHCLDIKSKCAAVYNLTSEV